MARQYQVLFEAVAVSAAQDLVAIPGTAKLMRILRCWVGCTDTAVATGQMLQLRARLATAAFAVGSGGTTGLTPTKIDNGDAACTCTTAGTNNTTPATGTFTKVYENGVHLYQGDVWQCPVPLPFIATTQGFVWELMSTVSGTVHLSGGVLFEEIG